MMTFRIDIREQEGWQCPASVLHLNCRALYQAVAYWILLQERAVTVREVSEAFAISVRRASDVLHYIVHDASSSIKSSVNLNRGNGYRRQKRVRIWQVYPQHFPQPRVETSKMKGSKPNKTSFKRPSQDEEILRLRTWFVSRRSGEALP
ncbi:CaiF/GrlA family transcriptional regulator [Salmonella enterica]|nr:CaiF/GrlA family transcriptional regulator [Salmonella enterica]